MWRRFVDRLRCPLCHEAMELLSFAENAVDVDAGAVALAKAMGVFNEHFNLQVNSGLIACHRCKKWYPIVRGLPVLLCFRTPVHQRFAEEHKERLRELPFQYEFPSLKPEPGEEVVQASFSAEWEAYDYDGVIWGMSYADHERRFLTEMGVNPDETHRGVFLEVGCGLGITTSLAQKNYNVDAVGVDLSGAVLKAAEQYKKNPFVHFAQASVFWLPFALNFADLVYSHGVLHHTYSTRKAFNVLAAHCKPGGMLYVWIYGTGSKRGSVLRRLAYMIEAMVRPGLSRRSCSPASELFLNVAASGYLLMNAWHRLRNSEIKAYNYRRAIHAARDRFTPLYADRNESDEVSRWFQEVGCLQIEQVNWRDVPPADQDNYRRNVGLRGRRKEVDVDSAVRTSRLSVHI